MFFNLLFLMPSRIWLLLFQGKKILEFNECFGYRVIKESKSRKIVPAADQRDLAAAICPIRDHLCSPKSLGFSVSQFPIYKKKWGYTALRQKCYSDKYIKKS